jgi:enamine deaminase RidA (YjgF/YER057c/UK114 family)
VTIFDFIHGFGMSSVFGENGRHARSAVGVFRLPFDFAVEIDAVIEIR